MWKLLSEQYCNGLQSVSEMLSVVFIFCQVDSLSESEDEEEEERVSYRL